MAMKGDSQWIHLTPVLRQALEDWRSVVQHLKFSPTSILQLVKAPYHYISYTDACSLRAGEVWCSGVKSIEPFLWQVEWPDDIKEQLVTR